MAYLRHAKDGLRVWESYTIKDALKGRGYTFDGRGYWYKLNKQIGDKISEYRSLEAIGVDLLLGDLSLDDVEKFTGKTSSEVVAMSMKNPGDGIKMMKTWNEVNLWIKNRKAKG